MWRARFASFCRKCLRFGAGLFVALLFALLRPAAAQDSGPRERVRFLDGKAEVCEIVSADAEGLSLKLEGLPRPVRFRWWQLDPEDAASLRARMLGGKATRTEPPAGSDLSVPGVRLRTHDGKTYEGVLLSGAPARDLWIKNSEGKYTVPVETVESREDVRLDLRRVYVPEEVVGILMGRLKPSTAEDYDKLGAELLRARLQERALAAFKMAELLRHPDWPESRMHAELVRLRDRIEDLAVRRSVYQAQESYLAGDYDATLAQIEAVEKALAEAPDSGSVLAELRRLRAQIQDYRGRARDERIVQETWRTMEAFLKTRAMDRALPWADARSFAEDAIWKEVFTHVRWRFNFSPDDKSVEVAWDRRPEDAFFKHSTDEASWFVLKPEVRSVADWWAAASDESRYKLLKGIAVEQHLRVIRTELKSCGTCGGTGLVDNAVCPACAGLKQQRILIYR